MTDRINCHRCRRHHLDLDRQSAKSQAGILRRWSECSAELFVEVSLEQVQSAAVNIIINSSSSSSSSTQSITLMLAFYVSDDRISQVTPAKNTARVKH